MTEFGEGRKPNQSNMYVIGAYKKQLLDALKLNPDFYRALLNKDLKTEDLSPVDKHNILYKDFNDCVFDHAFVPGTSTEKHIFVCTEIVCPSSDGDTFKTLYINLYVFTPKMLVQWGTKDELESYDRLLDRGYIGNKVDVVVDIIDREINGKKHLGLGKILLAPTNGMQIFNYVDGYYGKQLTYIATDFNLLPSSAIQDNHRDGKPENE